MSVITNELRNENKITQETLFSEVLYLLNVAKLTFWSYLIVNS